jgi:hypothetical protein
MSYNHYAGFEYIPKKGDIIQVSNNDMSIHKKEINNKVGIILDNGNRYGQFKVSIPNYKILHIHVAYLKQVK